MLGSWDVQLAKFARSCFILQLTSNLSTKELPMTAATVTNSAPPRKQLSDQLDRLDGILDALSEGLNGAVTDATREGVRLAVKDAVIELLTDPTLRARLHEAT